MQAAKLLAASGTASKLYAEDVFSAYTRTGTGASATVTTGIDMTQGYMLWTKGRSGATDHALYHSARGVTKDLVHNTTAAETTQATGLTAVSATGHTIGALAKMNTTSATYVDWVLRNADKFYNHTTVVKTGGSNATVSFSNLTTLGMVRVKRTDSTGSWYIWHRSLTAGKLLIGETTAAEATLGHITVSGTTVTLVNGVIADGTYLVEGFAHDTGTDGLIQCGSFTTDGSGNATVSLGWEPQFGMVKAVSGGAPTGNWTIADAARGNSTLSIGVSNQQLLWANDPRAEYSSYGYLHPTATGLSCNLSPSTTYIYLAIRRPNKPPTTGTQVYNAIARTGTGAAATVTGVGFAPDLVIPQNRNTANGTTWFSRLQGATKLLLNYGTNAELTDANSLTSFGMDGFSAGTDATNACINTNTNTYINHFFKRAPGVMDVVCYTGTGVARTVAHNLGVAPEFMIVKNRNNAAGRNWMVYHSAIGANKEFFLNNNGNASTVDTTYFNNTTPTTSVFSVGTANATNQSTDTFVAYLFATKAGISKVGSYTGNGSSQTIACGFTTGARFFLVKATSTTGSWWVFDTTRGIVASTDFGLQLNSTAAETTSADAVDPDTSGISVVQEATCSINANGVSYIFLALA